MMVTTYYKRAFLTAGAFWLSGFIAQICLSDPGALSGGLTSLFAFFCGATLGLFIGPVFFVAGLLPRCEEVSPLLLLLILGGALCSYVGYITLFVKATTAPTVKWRMTYLLLETLCAFIAVRGLIDSI